MVKMNTPGGVLKCGMWFVVPRGCGTTLQSSQLHLFLWPRDPMLVLQHICPLMDPQEKFIHLEPSERKRRKDDIFNSDLFVDCYFRVQFHK